MLALSMQASKLVYAIARVWKLEADRVLFHRSVTTKKTAVATPVIVR